MLRVFGYLPVSHYVLVGLSRKELHLDGPFLFLFLFCISIDQ